MLHPDDKPVLWLVTDGLGVTVDQTWEIEALDLAEVTKLAPRTGHSHETFSDLRQRRWRLALRRIHAGPVAIERGVSPIGETRGERQSLVIFAAESLAPLENTLRNVALVLAGLSVGFWLLAAVVGWWLCKRALLPVTRMARAAGSMSMADGGQRLPIPGTGDELDLLAGSFNGLLDRLHQEFERQKRFTGDASHQLRTPLAALLGQLEVARRRERSVEEYQRVLEEAHGEATRLRQIVESLLFMARAESEAGSVELEPIELVLWVRERLKCRPEDERSRDIHELLSTEAPAWVQGQPQLLGQLLGNLLDNACKYSQPRTPITVEVGREGGYATLSVQDEGVGLAADELPHIFEPFYRAAKARRRPGVGLGLAVVERIAHVFGGTIRAEARRAGKPLYPPASRCHPIDHFERGDAATGSGVRAALILSLSFRLPSFQVPFAAIPPRIFRVSGFCRRIPESWLHNERRGRAAVRPGVGRRRPVRQRRCAAASSEAAFSGPP